MTALAACNELTLGIALLVWHNGDIEHFASAALRGCRRSGDRARRSSGELGSALFGRTNDDFLPPDIVVLLLEFDVIFIDVEFGVFDPLLVNELFKLVLFGTPQPGLYDCVVFDAPEYFKKENERDIRDLRQLLVNFFLSFHCVSYLVDEQWLEMQAVTVIWLVMPAMVKVMVFWPMVTMEMECDQPIFDDLMNCLKHFQSLHHLKRLKKSLYPANSM